MRLCRFLHRGQIGVALYFDEFVVPLNPQVAQAVGWNVSVTSGDNLLDYAPPQGGGFNAARTLAALLTRPGHEIPPAFRLAVSEIELLVPVPRPNKLFLLAGNYADHIREGGGVAAERAETFPYVFMKPASTTLTDPGKPVQIPQISPQHIDWECELAVVIGRRGKHIPESEALSYVAGYTVINDISDRQFRPNPGRKPRDNDKFFDWLHGKWHDSFCPCGPCLTTADAIPDPQQLALGLSVNGQVRQQASTSQQIFPVAAVIEFLSHICTLEPGDIISTGTPAGVGHTTGTYLHHGDVVEAWIERIGTLRSPVVAES
jgi:2-keto-4-pentenoate hydratase/2-oxohepta-3-ene-1,7-dioic acid hydratase in catechol pathway